MGNHYRAGIQQTGNRINDFHRSIFAVMFPGHQRPSENRQSKNGGRDHNFDCIVFHNLFLSFSVFLKQVFLLSLIITEIQTILFYKINKKENFFEKAVF